MPEPEWDGHKLKMDTHLWFGSYNLTADAADVVGTP